MMKLTRALSLAALALLASCKANDAMDNTTTMKDDLGGMKHTTEGMAGDIGQTNAHLSEVERATHVATGVALLDLSVHDYKSYLPPPAEVLSGAQQVAKYMTEEELKDYFFARYEEFANTTPDQSQNDPHLVGGYSVDYTAEYNIKQMVRGVILQAIAGQVPQSMIHRLVMDEVINNGARRQSTLAMLMFRAVFLDSFMLKSDIFGDGFDLTQANRGAEQIGNLKYLYDLPFATEIALKVPSVAFLPALSPAQLQEGDADYEAKCQNQTPADPACVATLGRDPGSALYNQALKLAPPVQPADPAQPRVPEPEQKWLIKEQAWWKKLAGSIEDTTDCNSLGRPILRHGLLIGHSVQEGTPEAAELKQIAEDAKKNYPAVVCPAH